MQINEESWQRLDGKLLTLDAAPPTVVFLTMQALIGGAGVVAGSHAQMDLGDETTTWTNWVVTTAGSLAHTKIVFKAENYDQGVEWNAMQRRHDHYVENTVEAAWIRPLSEVSNISIEGVGSLVSERTWFPVGSIALTFKNGDKVVVPGQERVHRVERPRSDEFVGAVRAAVPF